MAALDEDPYKVMEQYKSLKAKYLAERDKRLRAEGNDQFVKLFADTEKFKHFIEDPYVPEVPRAPVAAECEVLLLGGGFSSLLNGSKLRKAGVKSIRVIEEGGGFGGTWYWNRYPGAACDTEALIYLPLLEEFAKEDSFVPEWHYVKASEILRYCNMIAKKYNLAEGALFSTHVEKLIYNEKDAIWDVSTNRGDKIRAKFVISSIGLFPRAKLPAVTGLDKFKGKMFHTSRWDYSITGGTSDGNLEKLKDMRVAFIGTGATAIQAVPHLGQYAKHLYVFQRTPSSVDVRNQRKVDVNWFKELIKTPGWQKRRMESFNVLTQGGIDDDLVGDAWTSTLQFILSLKKKYAKSGMKNGDLLQLADFQKMDQIRGRVDEIVKDKQTAEKLKPYYNQYCKRPTFSDEYLQTFNRPNVTLVDTEGQGVRELTENGVVALGKEYPVDLIIFGTGFEVGVSYTYQAGYNVIGRGGVRLADKWNEGMSTLFGIMTNGFPNYFLVQGQQGAFLYNNHSMIETLSEHIVYMIDQARKRGIRAVEPTKKAEDEWVETIIKTASLRKTFYEECTPGYYNLEGQVSRRVARNLQYGLGSVAFFDLLEKWRRDGKINTDMVLEQGAKASL